MRPAYLGVEGVQLVPTRLFRLCVMTAAHWDLSLTVLTAEYLARIVHLFPGAQLFASSRAMSRKLGGRKSKLLGFSLIISRANDALPVKLS